MSRRCNQIGVVISKEVAKRICLMSRRQTQAITEHEIRGTCVLAHDFDGLPKTKSIVLSQMQALLLSIEGRIAERHLIL